MGIFRSQRFENIHRIHADASLNVVTCSADIVLKSEYYGKPIRIRAVHSIHFGSPILTHHIQSDLPYITDNAQIQKLIADQSTQLSSEQLRQRRRALRRTGQNTNDNASESKDDEDEQDLITKQMIPEIVYSGFTLVSSVLYL